jgi:hypothetical protein
VTTRFLPLNVNECSLSITEASAIAKVEGLKDQSNLRRVRFAVHLSETLPTLGVSDRNSKHAALTRKKGTLKETRVTTSPNGDTDNDELLFMRDSFEERNFGAKEPFIEIGDHCQRNLMHEFLAAALSSTTIKSRTLNCGP